MTTLKQTLLEDIFSELSQAQAHLIAHGDRLAESAGLTHARMQVMRIILEQGAHSTTPNIARALGLKRQSVQRIVNELDDEKLLVLYDNPNHQRSYLLELTPKGKKLYQLVRRKQKKILEKLAQNITKDVLEHTTQVLAYLKDALTLDD